MDVNSRHTAGQPAAYVPRVSVIVPFLDLEPYLKETIESVRNQTYPSWELVLVDDGSTDASTDIARDYAARHPGRIRYLDHENHQNRGVNYSRTVGVTASRGELIALLDGDDVWFPRKLEEQIALFDAHPDAAMFYSNTQYWFSWTGDPADQHRDFVVPLGLTGTLVRPPALLIQMLLQRVAVPCTCSVIVRRETVIRLNGFAENWPNHADQTFYTRVLLAEPVLVVDRVWDRYRRHGRSICAKLDAAGAADAARLRYLSWVAGYVRTAHGSDPEVLAAVRAAIRRLRYPRIHRAWNRARQAAQNLVRVFDGSRPGSRGLQ